MGNSFTIKNAFLALLVWIISVVVFIESSIPYITAQNKTKAGHVFLGQISYTADQDMYFSFIRQARDGQFIFNNRLTYTPNKPAFVNLEFWLIGTIERFTGMSENAIYYTWRYLGILLLSIGITLLAKIILPSTKQVLACVAILLFTGGFGFIFAALSNVHLISLSIAHAGIIDMRYGFLPFQQAVSNPNFSFPHGLILIAYACFVLGEQTGKVSWYLRSGLAFMIIALVRPYDIIPPFVIFPIYLLISNGSFKFNIKQVAGKLLPLFMIVPVVIYNIWLFKFNDAFKGWSTQGLNANSLPSGTWHYLSYGIIGILAIVRLAQFRSNPLTKTDKFLVVWFLTTFIFIHLGKYFPVIGWSPQIGVYLAVPLALLGCSIKYTTQRAKPLRYATITITALCVIVSNLSIVVYYVKNFSDPAKTPTFYANKEELDAWAWINKATKPGDVILATPATSLRLAKYTDASVVAAHYSVTPKYIETSAIADNIYAAPLLGNEQKTILQNLNVQYVYIGPTENNNNQVKVEQCAYLQQVYANPLVTIYKVVN